MSRPRFRIQLQNSLEIPLCLVKPAVLKSVLTVLKYLSRIGLGFCRRLRMN